MTLLKARIYTLTLLDFINFIYKRTIFKMLALEQSAEVTL